MEKTTKQFGLTIIEALVALAIVAILMTLTLGITSTVRDKGKQQLTEQTITLLTTALQEYYQFWGEFPLKDGETEIDKDYNESDLESDLNGSVSSALHDPNGSSIEWLYFGLNKTPLSRKIIEKIAQSQITAKGTDKQTALVITINTKDYDLFRVVDGWKIPLRYTYDKVNDSFPLIESAGADKVFGDGLSSPGDGKEVSYSEDNITNR